MSRFNPIICQNYLITIQPLLNVQYNWLYLPSRTVAASPVPFPADTVLTTMLCLRHAYSTPKLDGLLNFCCEFGFQLGAIFSNIIGNTIWSASRLVFVA